MQSLRIVHLKLIRAQEHLNALKTEIAVFREIQPYAVIEDRDSDPNALIVSIRAQQNPNARWSIILGDFVHNLRSALDLLANQLVRAAGNTPVETGPSSKRTQFPILDERRGKVGEWKPKIYGGVSDVATALIDELQP